MLLNHIIRTISRRFEFLWILFIAGSIISCAKIEQLASSLTVDKSVAAGYGEDPASMIAAQTAIRNSLEPFITDRTIFENVFFGPNSAILDETAKAVLWKKILWLEENPATVLVIEGHSDSVGDELINLVMGERRAESVKTFLVELGIDGERLITVSYGEEHPMDSDANEEEPVNNRRVSFSIQ